MSKLSKIYLVTDKVSYEPSLCYGAFISLAEAKKVCMTFWGATEIHIVPIGKVYPITGYNATLTHRECNIIDHVEDVAVFPI